MSPAARVQINRCRDCEGTLTHIQVFIIEPPIVPGNGDYLQLIALVHREQDESEQLTLARALRNAADELHPPRRRPRR